LKYLIYKINNNKESVNLAFSKTSKSKALSSTSLETASSSLVGSSNNAAMSILHIKNSNSSFSEQASKSFSSNSETKKKSKGKHKDKAEEDPEIEEIRNSANNISILDEVSEDFMGLASSSLNGGNNRNYNTVKEGGTKGKNKLKEDKYNTFSSRFNYGKGPSAVIEGPYTVFHSSSSSSSLDFLLESAAVASSSHNDEPPLNINFNRNQANNNNNNNDINNINSSLGNDRFDIERLVILIYKFI